jgi:hypothetical protein
LNRKRNYEYTAFVANKTEIMQNTFKNAVKGKAIPLQALTGPEGSMRLRFSGFKTIGT